jgi:hypothetical protein
MPKSSAVIFVSLAVALLAGGCQEPSDVTVAVVDGSPSAAQNRDAFLDDFERRIVAGGYLQGDLALVHACHTPHLLWSGKAHQVAELKAAIAKARRHCRCNPKTESPATFCGTDAAGGCEIARQWLARPEFRTARKHRVWIWSDGVSDPCKAGDKPRVFDDPLKFSWGQGVRPEIHVWGLSQSRSEELSKTWEEWKPCPHLPGETKLDPEHLGLHAEAF